MENGCEENHWCRWVKSEIKSCKPINLQTEPIKEKATPPNPTEMNDKPEYKIFAIKKCYIKNVTQQPIVPKKKKYKYEK